MPVSTTSGRHRERIACAAESGDSVRPKVSRLRHPPSRCRKRYSAWRVVPGASTADVAILLVDARNGVRTQSRRHARIARLLGITDFVLAVNKMDLMDFDQDVFDKIVDDLMVRPLPVSLIV